MKSLLLPSAWDHHKVKLWFVPHSHLFISTDSRVYSSNEVIGSKESHKQRRGVKIFSTHIKTRKACQHHHKSNFHHSCAAMKKWKIAFNVLELSFSFSRFMWITDAENGWKMEWKTPQASQRGVKRRLKWEKENLTCNTICESWKSDRTCENVNEKWWRKKVTSGKIQFF